MPPAGTQAASRARAGDPRQSAQQARAARTCAWLECHLGDTAWWGHRPGYRLGGEKVSRPPVWYFIFLRFYLFLLLERREGREKERERNINMREIRATQACALTGN